MHFRQFYLGCLAHASYFIGSRGEAAVVDPQRDVQQYLDEAERQGTRIRYVIETHLHADFVSGHRELADRSGAEIVFGAASQAEVRHRGVRDGDELRVGDVVLRAIETPGHTPESLCFVIYEGPRETPWGVLTGDTMFVGDVGRVDILSSRLPVKELAGMMYDSLHQKLLTLPDETRVYPAHGAGSLCGRNISKETWSTIGRERAMNAALVDHGRAAFIEDITRDVPETPVYFLHSRDLNRAGPALDEARGFPPTLAPRECAERAKDGAVLLDTRPAEAFGQCHPAGALSVSLDGQYASWVGTLLGPDQDIILVTEPDRAEEAVTRLARVGYERIVGIMDGGCERWRADGLPVASTRQMPASELRPGDAHVLDVRRRGEWDRFHLAGATLVPLSQLPERAKELDRAAEWSVVCASGYRSVIAASVLERAGLRARNVTGGMDAYRRAGLPVEAAASA